MLLVVFWNHARSDKYPLAPFPEAARRPVSLQRCYWAGGLVTGGHWQHRDYAFRGKRASHLIDEHVRVSVTAALRKNPYAISD